ncbi:MAG: YdcF family protein [Clostridia bacterium]|nr:YdcF family protein [Clostridia bacterium]
MKVFRVILIVLGALLVLDTLIIAPMSNFNLGVILPAILGLPLLIAGIFLPQLAAWAEMSKFGAVIKWLFLGGYSVFLAAFLVTLALMLKASFVQPQQGADAVIVLGAGVRGDRVTLTLARRLDTAKKYWESNPDTLLVVSGGQGQGESVTEAYAMEKYLLEHGVPQENILKEERATSTLENFRYSMELIRERFGDNPTVVYVTTAVPVFRAGKVAEKAGLSASGMGCPTTWYIIPNCYLRESIAIWSYWLFGRI